MKIFREKYKEIVQIFLVLIAITIIFRIPCTRIIIGFTLFCLINYKVMNFPKKTWINVLAISTPLILEILFFWNNQDKLLGLKSLEKNISLLIFPILIIGNYKVFNFERLLKQYAIITILLMIGLMIRYYIFYNQYFLSFYYGMNMWNMGYHFAGTIGIHAPALNMHLVFVSTILFYFTLNSLVLINNKKHFVFNCILFLISFMFLLVINTRISLLCAFISYFIVIIFQFNEAIDIKKAIKYTLGILAILFVVLFLFIKNNSYMEEKYNRMLFDKMNMIGKLDKIERPETEIYSSLVTRVTIWKTTIELSQENFWYGVGSSDSKPHLFEYYEKTNQKFLAKYKLPVHNQYLDFLLKFGVLGLLGVFIYMGNIAYFAVKLKNATVFSFFTLFFISNFTEDFLIRFDGIVFSGFWISIFVAYYFQKKQHANNE